MVYETSGAPTGYIVKFEHFYLKIYDDLKSDRYVIIIFPYDEHINIPINRVLLPITKMKALANALVSEEKITPISISVLNKLLEIFSRSIEDQNITTPCVCRDYFGHE